MTMASPTKNGSEPIAKSAATMMPQIAIGTGLAITARIDIAIEQHRERNRADQEAREREQETGSVAVEDQLVAGAGRQHFVEKFANIARRVEPEQRLIDRLRGIEPCQKQDHQHDAETRDGADRRRMQHVEGVPPCCLQARFAAAAHLIKADRGNRADQRKARHQRKQERQYRRAKREAAKAEADDRVDQAQEKQLRREGREIFPAFAERVLDVVKADLADRRMRRTVACARDDMKIGHAIPPQSGD